MLALLLAPALAGVEQPLPIVPRPQSVGRQAGEYVLRAPVRIAVTGGGADLREVAGFLRDFLAGATGMAVTVGARPAGAAIVIEAGEPALPGPEAYELAVTPAGIRIRARDAAGAFWGVQTLRQLLPPDLEARGARIMALPIPTVSIHDAPRFEWRGSLLDVGRHFFPIAFVKRYINLLALHKMNVLHWHLTEDQGWRVEIAKYPRLTEVGAWRTERDGTRHGGFYTKAEVRDIVEYARCRHVMIVPEIEMPGHSTAALVAYPQFSCTGESTAVPTTWGVFADVYCPGKEETFRFLQDVLDEVMDLFPSKTIHIGGDEVPKDHWKACALCQQRMRAEGLKAERELQSYFIRRIDAYVRSKGREITGWDEILEGGLAAGATVQVWRDVAHVKTTTALGNRVVASPTSHAYLDASPASLPLRRVYEFDPVPPGLSPAEAARIRGGEANIWTEGINEANFDQIVFPRLAAMAEALWSRPGGAFDEFRARLDGGHRARLRALGVAFGPDDQALMRMTPFFDPATRRAGLRVERRVDGLVVRQTIDGSAPTPASEAIGEMAMFARPSAYRLQPFLNGKATPTSLTLTVDRHLAVGQSVTLAIPNSPKYTGTGVYTLSDGLRGTTDFHDGLWQGWEGEDMEAVIDLQQSTTIREIEVSTLQAMRSWILLPRRVAIWLSDDGAAWRPAAEMTHDVPQRREDAFVYPFCCTMPANTAARYVKVRATNAGPLPDWHPGAGGKAWVFVDEIVVR
jgi:hexosaminidase